MTRRAALLLLVPPPPTAQAGQILIASTALADSDFAKTVILLLSVDTQVAVGLVLNRPLRRRPGEPQYYAGGPVPSGVRSLVRAPSGQDSRRICSGVHLVPGEARSQDARIFVGYTGWTADQLQQELSRGYWRAVPCDSAIVFDPDPGTLWQRLSARQA